MDAWMEYEIARVGNTGSMKRRELMPQIEEKKE